MAFGFICSAVVKCLLHMKIFCCPVWFYTNKTEKQSDRECDALLFSVIYAPVYPARQPTYPREPSEYLREQRSDNSLTWLVGLERLISY